MAAGEEVRLTRFSHGLGCGCKLRPQDLALVLAGLPPLFRPEVLVGPEHSDDAAVWRLDDTTALVVTVDFFTPVVDDPFSFGEVAAANALSDVYAMGGEPLFALNIVAFPATRLPLSVLHDILAGARSKAAEAGVPLLGGHTIEDPEPKFGMVVIGRVHPREIWTNAGGRPGDALLLTKPLGSGVFATAAKRGAADPAQLAVAVRTMATLNAAAATALRGFTVHAATDVTGFGLLGHLRELTAASGVDARLDSAAVPLLPGVLALARAGHAPGAAVANAEHVAPHVDFPRDFSPVLRTLLHDPQTSGGLLVALPGEEAAAAIGALAAVGVDAVRVGELTEPGAGRVRVQ
jgi:selenide,water dikinase